MSSPLIWRAVGGAALADKTGYELSTYARHVKGLLDYRGLETVDWLGIGMGGWLGLVLAAEEDSPIPFDPERQRAAYGAGG